MNPNCGAFSDEHLCTKKIGRKKERTKERKKERKKEKRKKRKMHSLLGRLTNGRGSRVAGCMSRVLIGSRGYDLDDVGAGVRCRGWENNFA